MSAPPKGKFDELRRAEFDTACANAGLLMEELGMEVDEDDRVYAVALFAAYVLHQLEIQHAIARRNARL